MGADWGPAASSYLGMVQFSSTGQEFSWNQRQMLWEAGSHRSLEVRARLWQTLISRDCSLQGELGLCSNICKTHNDVCCHVASSLFFWNQVAHK